MRRLVGSIVLALAMNGCVAYRMLAGPRREGNTVADVIADAATPLSHAELRAIVEDVAELRGVEMPGGLAIELQDRQAYDAGMEESVERAAAEAASVAPGEAAHLRAGARALAASAAHYSWETRNIVVRLDPDRSRDSLRSVVAHEAAHALQHARFGRWPKLSSSDAKAAYNALVEGDADLTAALYLAARVGVERWRMLRGLADPESVRATLASGVSDAEAARAVFPYAAGARFAAELVRAGGLPLLDRAFRDCPSTTEHILHPDKYLAGEQAIGVLEPAVPRGMKSLGSGVRGELETVLLLLECADIDEAMRAAAGWGGDAYTLLGRADGQHASLWSTVWDTEHDAREMEQLARRSGCFENALVRRQGRRVAIAENVGPSAWGHLTRLLAAPLREASVEGGAPPHVPQNVRSTTSWGSGARSSSRCSGCSSKGRASTDTSR